MFLIFLQLFLINIQLEGLPQTSMRQWWFQGSPLGDSEDNSNPFGDFEPQSISEFRSPQSDEAIGNNYGESRHLCFELVAKFSKNVNPDGVKKEVITVNDRFPGPTIRVKLGDTVTIRVRNLLKDSSGRKYPTSVHWHGIEMRGTPWWDGPELVNQCPIPYGGFMDYTFKLIQCGTYWWHAHTSWQYLDGFWGFLIVDSNTTEVHSYDDEILMSLFDWQWLPGQPLTDIFHLPVTAGRVIEGAGLTPIPDSALINGRGNADCGVARDAGFKCNPRRSDEVTVFNVFAGWTYRIRVLNPSGHAAYNFSIDGHTLRVIEIDGVDTVESEGVDLVTIWPAQRYSFLVTMNSTQKTDSFWIRAVSYIVAPLTRMDREQLANIMPLAVIHYLGEEGGHSNCEFVDQQVSQGLRYPRGSQGGGRQGRPSCKRAPEPLLPVQRSYCNNFIRPTGNIDKAQITVERSCFPRYLSYEEGEPFVYDQMMSPPVAVTCEGDSAPERFDEQVIFLAANSNDTLGFMRWHLSNITYTTEGQYIPAILRVTEKEKVPIAFNPQYISFLKDIQVVVNNDNDGAHPFHLHGHTFWVIGVGDAGEGDFDPVRDEWRLRGNTAIRRDTTHVNARSWLVFRFTADNPGTWLFHCHINWHLDRGLAAIFVEAEEQVVCKYQVPEEIIRVCEKNRVLVSGSGGGGRGGNWSPYYRGTCEGGSGG